MELYKIEALVKKYMEAETSIAEEKELQAYFTSGNVAPHLQEYVPLFSYFKKEKEVALTKEAPKKRKWRSTYEWFAVAASVAIIGGVFFFSSNNTTETDLGTYEDPQLAYQQTKEVLDMISYYMNTGQENLAYINELGETTKKIIKN